MERNSGIIMKGFTLVEMIVAITIISIGLLSIAVLFPAYIKSQIQNDKNIEALKLCNQKLDYLKSLDFSDEMLKEGVHKTETLFIANNNYFVRDYTVQNNYPIKDTKKIITKVMWKEKTHTFNKQLQIIVFNRRNY